MPHQIPRQPAKAPVKWAFATILLGHLPTYPRRPGSPPALRLRVRSLAVADRLVDLTDRDTELLRALTQRVRVFTLAQVARTWWPESQDGQGLARRRLRALEDGGLVTLTSLIAHPEIDLAGPLSSWQPGLPEPDFGPVARELARRWTEPERQTLCVVASEEAASVVGGSGGRTPRDSEATHDIHLAAVYLRMAEKLPTRASSWRAEASLAKGQGVKVPDAMVRDGKYDTAIEFGGSYSAEKLASFHRYCHRKGLGYELW